MEGAVGERLREAKFNIHAKEWRFKCVCLQPHKEN